MPDEKPKTHERIIDAAEEAPRGVALLRASLVLLLWALLAGVVVGAGCLATLTKSSAHNTNNRSIGCGGTNRIRGDKSKSNA